MIKVSLPKIICNQCNNKFIPRKEEVYFCPKCRSHDFDKPKKIKDECQHCGYSFTRRKTEPSKRCPQCLKFDPIKLKKES